jgi:hypothetical protein
LVARLAGLSIISAKWVIADVLTAIVGAADFDGEIVQNIE